MSPKRDPAALSLDENTGVDQDCHVFTHLRSGQLASSRGQVVSEAGCLVRKQAGREAKSTGHSESSLALRQRPELSQRLVTSHEGEGLVTVPRD
jgi:hypothetical protein